MIKVMLAACLLLAVGCTEVTVTNPRVNLFVVCELPIEALTNERQLQN
jgi:hypothetical protein